MSILRVIRAGACPPVAWKNGGGTTREIAVFPPGAGMDDFLWRLSIAQVEQAGPFSSFVGVERVLAVLEGRLHLWGDTMDVELTPRNDPFRFDGAAAVQGAPCAGPVRDINAMVRRGHAGVRMQRLAAGDRFGPGGTDFLIALERQEVEHVRLHPLDCVLVDGPVFVRGSGIGVSFSTAG